MFGKRMLIQAPGGIVRLKPFKVDEMITNRVLGMLADHDVTKYTLMQHSPTEGFEREWYEKVTKSKDEFIWGIYFEDSELIGLTSLRIQEPHHQGSTGFMLFDKAFWRKKIASHAHIARTHYAVNHLDLKTIKSVVVSKNTGSLRALQSVGYFVNGFSAGEYFRDGESHDQFSLQWIRPELHRLFLQKAPRDIKQKAKIGLLKTKETLERAKLEVKYF